MYLKIFLQTLARATNATRGTERVEIEESRNTRLQLINFFLLKCGPSRNDGLLTNLRPTLADKFIRTPALVGPREIVEQRFVKSPLPANE